MLVVFLMFGAAGQAPTLVKAATVAGGCIVENRRKVFELSRFASIFTDRVVLDSSLHQHVAVDWL